MVMRRYFDFKIDGGNYRQAGSEQIGFVKCADFRNISSRQHTNTDSYIPRSKIGGSGRPRWLLGARLTNSVLNAGNMIPKPTPISSATPKNRIVQAASFH